MHQVGGLRRRSRTRPRRRLTLLLQNLEYQLNYLDTLIVEPTRNATPFQEAAFQRMDTNHHWAIRFPIDEYHDEPQHRCAECHEKLDSLCQAYRGKALCSQCFLTTPSIPVCSACHHTIEGRVVLALGRAWHPHHLVCIKCEEVLSGGGSFYEHNGDPLCFYHLRSLTQEICHKCRNFLPECLVEFTNKFYCLEHFSCEFCDKQLYPGSHFFTIDLRPICNACYRRLPGDLQRNLQKWRRRERHRTHFWLRDFVDRLLCIYPRSNYATKRIPLDHEALPYLRSGQIIR